MRPVDERGDGDGSWGSPEHGKTYSRHATSEGQISPSFAAPPTRRRAEILMKLMILLVALVLLTSRDTNTAASPRTAPRAAAPKVLVFVDMDGSSGVNRARQVLYPNKEYFDSRHFITSDLNAVIRGLKDGGAGEIVVTDAHGSGNAEEPDVLLDQMDKRATFLIRDAQYRPYVDAPDSSYQAIVCVGMHARANTPGFMAHTVTLEPIYKVNGVPVTESAMIALSAARFGIPVIMIAGDDVLREQIKEEFPSAEYALVKRARGKADAELIAQTTVQSNIVNAARSAIQKLASFKPYAVTPSYRFEVGYQNPRQADLASAIPGSERLDSVTLHFTTKTFAEGYDRSLRMNGMARLDGLRFLAQAVRARPDGGDIMAEYTNLLITSWLEPEKLPKVTAPAAPAGKRHFGSS